MTNAVTSSNTEILIPFIGAFSSGKSSLINALLGENLLSTDITPETALPIELRFGEQSRFVACLPDDREKSMTKKDFLAADFSELASQDGFIRAYLPQMATWQNLVLVDLPGWSSGQSEHEAHIDDYLLKLAKTHLDKNTCFVVAVSADEGTLRENVRERLQNLDFGGSSYFLVITKSDKRDEADIEKITRHLTEVITATLGKVPQQVIITSARKKSSATLHQALDALQKAIDDKKPVDTAAIVLAIDRHLEKIEESADGDNTGYARDDICDDTWDKFSDDAIDCDGMCSYVHWKATTSLRELLVGQMGRRYQENLSKNMKKYFPAPDATLLAGLESLNLSAPAFNDMEDTVPALSNWVKTNVKTAIEKSEPGFFASDDPKAVGERLRSHLRDMRKTFRSNIYSASSTAIQSWLERQRKGWQRLRDLISV